MDKDKAILERVYQQMVQQLTVRREPTPINPNKIIRDLSMKIRYNRVELHKTAAQRMRPKPAQVCRCDKPWMDPKEQTCAKCGKSALEL